MARTSSQTIHHVGNIVALERTNRPSFIFSQEMKFMFGFVLFMVFNANFNNISAIWWWSVLLVEETGESEKTTDPSQVTDKLHHIMLYRVHLAMNGFELTTFVVIGTDQTGRYNSNYHKITTTGKEIQQTTYMDKSITSSRIRKNSN